MPSGASLTTQLILIPLLALCISACGSSDEEAPSTPPPPTQEQQAPVVSNNTPEASPAINPPATQVVAQATPIESKPLNSMTTPSGLQYTELRAGSGPKPQAGEVVSVHYTGKLADGTKFDSSLDRGEPIRFALGKGNVISGWDEGIALMNKGGHARLVIPPNLAYGEQGAGGVIPPNATLTFDVELVDIAPGSPAAPTIVDSAQYSVTDRGIKWVDLVEGEGPVAQNGQLMVVNYTGWLEDGTKFDSSLDRGEPFTFNLGMGQVIPGWDLGMRGMKVGSTRQIVIPAALAYGERGAGGVIPPGANLTFEVDLLELQ